MPELGTTVADALLATHRSYLTAMRPLLDASLVKGMAHITGGGITENLPRIFPDGCSAEIDRASWSVPLIFRFIAERGGIADTEMLRAFNMGIGLIVACSASDRDAVLARLAEGGETGASVIGRVITGDGSVRYRS